jgi:hypothetical protein
MTYDFKRIEETFYAVLAAVVVFAAMEAAGHQDFSDWRTWLPVLAGGCIRAAAGALVAVLTKK